MALSSTNILKTLMAAAAFLFFYCTPAVVHKPPVIENVPDQPVRITRGDTVNYQIGFVDSRERERFIYGFERFLKEQSFQTERYDSAGTFTSFKVLPASSQAAETAPAANKNGAEAGRTEGKPAQKDTAKGTVAVAAPGATSDSAKPRFTGSLRIYVPRGSIGCPFSALVDAYPLCEKTGNDSIGGYLAVDNVAPNAITLKVSGKVVNGAGQAVSALDFINQWTSFIREHPAEGLALFRWCDGITEFIRGREALIRGLQAIDDKTIRIKLSAPDPFALDRLRTPRALPAGFKLGAYYVKISRETENALSSHRSAAGIKPFLNECLIRTGGDNNALVSYSLGRYDAILLSGSADLDYARRNLLKDGTCACVTRDRYFIANNIGDSATRAYVQSLVSGADLLKNAVKAEGNPIQRIETDSVDREAFSAPAGARPALTDPVRIVFRKDDAISKIIAEKLLAALTRAGLPGDVAAADEKTYESALVTHNYNCIVGWAPESVLTDTSERLRLATLYFNDEAGEEARISSSREVPLFSIDWYLLAKSKVGLYQGKVSGIYLKQTDN
jgi:hypothetical protein